jgi:hypothetical protein
MSRTANTLATLVDYHSVTQLEGLERFLFSCRTECLTALHLVTSTDIATIVDNLMNTDNTNSPVSTDSDTANCSTARV